MLTRTSSTAANRELAEEAGLAADSLHLEQLGVYGAPGRDPRGRVVSVAHLAIAPQLPEPVAGTDAVGACWIAIDQVLSGQLKLAFDHWHILVDGVERARAKLEHTSLATAFCGRVFTISELQQVYEAVWGVRLDPRNFYRKVQGTRRLHRRGRPDAKDRDRAAGPALPGGPRQSASSADDPDIQQPDERGGANP